MEEKNKRRFKPVLKTTTTIPSNVSSLPTTPEQPLAEIQLTQSIPKTVNASTQKRQKIQKVLDGQVKKITSPRKKRINSDASISESSSSAVTLALQAESNLVAVTQPANLESSPPLEGNNGNSGRSLTSLAQESATTTSFSPPEKVQKKRKSKTALTNNLDNDDGIESKPRRSRKPKDPNAPKRPANAYLLFSMIKR